MMDDASERDPLWRVLRVLPGDYSNYGGGVERWADDEENYPDCSIGCAFWIPLAKREGVDPLPFSTDWGVCANPDSHRSGLLTWEHQAGYRCYVPGPNACVSPDGQSYE